MTRRPRALVYADVDMNVIDGSSVWAQSAVQAFAAAGCDVELVLKAPVTTDRLLAPLTGLDGVTIRRTHEERLLADGTKPLTPARFAALAAKLDAQAPYDLVVLRGFALVRAVVAAGRFDGRLWTYLTDIPQTVADVTPEAHAQLAEVAAASRFLLCQTEELRGFLETMFPAACGKSLLFPPVVPAVAAPRDRPPPSADGLALVYIGKFARRWNTLEMTALPAQLAQRGIDVTLTMVGDKVHRGDDVMPDFRRRMQQALTGSPGVDWVGGRSRAEAMALAATADVGLSWRDPELDASLELSTKVLEYGALRLPVVLNRTPAHEGLLGPDYPLFAESDTDVVAVLAAAATDPARHALAVARCAAAADGFGLDRAVARTRGYLDRAFPTAPALVHERRRRRVGVATHDWKFFTRILDHLAALPEVELRQDRWLDLNRNDPAASQAVLDWADVVICEWCGLNAAWYSQRKRPGQRLIVRLHRFELYTGYPGHVVAGNVDQVVTVSPHYARLTRDLTGWPHDRVVVIPNWVDVDLLDRPKGPDARFHLGMIGVAPARKRMDIGLDVLERLRAADLRYRLFVKSKLVWDYWWMWRNPQERAHFDAVLRRSQTSPLLDDAVVFDGFGPDVAPWLRRVGYVLSTSDDESFHLSPAEGMASGAVPVIRDWPGVEAIYDARWVQPTADDMAARILGLDHDGWEHERAAARRQVAAFDLPAVMRLWERILVEDLDPAGDRRLTVTGA